MKTGRRRLSRRALSICLMVVGPLWGCAEQMPDGPRVTTYPVSGQVLVDGKPAGLLAIRCLPVGEKSAELPTSSAFTDKDGRFSISTFESGDGAPPGKYKLTFFWGQHNLGSGGYGGPDKLKKKYDDVEKSPVEVTVADGPVDLGVIELSTTAK